MKRIALAAEDNGHFRAVTKLVDDSLVTNIDWLDGILESNRVWCGLHGDAPWYKYDPEDANDLRPFTADGVTFKPQGRIRGESLKPEAGMWRRVLWLFRRAVPCPDVVVLIRDLDGYPDRRAGMEQARDGILWPFPVVIATPDPEIEAWLVAGFIAANDDEAARLQRLSAELSFDPTLQSHRLTSHPNDAPRDAKRTLTRLCQNDGDRELACLADRDRLRQRAAWAREFLDEVDKHLVQIFR